MPSTRWSWNAFVGSFLLVAGLLLLVHNIAPFPLPGTWIWTALLALAAIPFLWAWGTDRARWWAIIPAGTLLSLAGTTLLAGLSTDASRYAGSLFLFGLGGTFFAVYLARPFHRWALIPAGLLTLLAFSGLLAALPFIPQQWQGALGGSIFLAGLGVGFLLVAVLRRDIWWPILPGGLLLVLAALPILGEIAGLHQWIPAILFCGTALVFFAVHLVTRMRWSLWVAGATLAAGLFVQLAAGPGWFSGFLIGIALIALGILLLARRVAPR